MKLLVINPNTTAAMTAKVVAEVQRLAGPAITVQGVTARFGCEVIASRSAFAVAGHAALDAYAQAIAAHGPVDAVILACFGDPGLAALQELSPVPVVGLAQAAILQARARQRPFAIVTAGKAWAAMLHETILQLQAAAWLRGIITLDMTGLAVSRDASAALPRVQQAVDQAQAGGAQTVILGGAGFAAFTPQLQSGVLLVDCIQSAVERALRTANGPGLTAGDAHAPGAQASSGLSAELAGLLRQSG